MTHPSPDPSASVFASRQAHYRAWPTSRACNRLTEPASGFPVFLCRGMQSRSIWRVAIGVNVAYCGASALIQVCSLLSVAEHLTALRERLDGGLDHQARCGQAETAASQPTRRGRSPLDSSRRCVCQAPGGW
jgi:hypothetical protein